MFPEGIAFDPGARDFFVGSTETGTIYRTDLDDGSMQEFLPGGRNGRTTAWA